MIEGPNNLQDYIYDYGRMMAVTGPIGLVTGLFMASTGLFDSGKTGWELPVLTGTGLGIEAGALYGVAFGTLHWLSEGRPGKEQQFFRRQLLQKKA